MKCEEVQAKLAELSADALEKREAASVRAHFEVCDACRREYEVLERTLALLPLAERPELPRDLWPGVQARLRETARARPVLWRWPAAVAAAAALLVLVFGGLWRMRGPSELPVQVAYVQVSGTARARGEDHVDSYLQQHLALASDQPFADQVGMNLPVSLETRAQEGP